MERFNLFLAPTNCWTERLKTFGPSSHNRGVRPLGAPYPLFVHKNPTMVILVQLRGIAD
jgi:hypothetical protein